MSNSTKQAYSIAEVTRQAGIGRSSIYQAIKDGRLIARKMGRRTVILHDDLVEWLRSLPQLEVGAPSF